MFYWNKGIIKVYKVLHISQMQNISEISKGENFKSNAPVAFVSWGFYQHQMITLNNHQSKAANISILWYWRSVNHLLIELNVKALISLWTELYPDAYKHPALNMIFWLWTHCQTKQCFTVLISLHRVQELQLHTVDERWHRTPRKESQHVRSLVYIRCDKDK